MADPVVTAPVGNVAFTGNPLMTSAYGTSDPGAMYVMYQVNSNSPSSITFDPTTGAWNVPYLTTTDCPTVGIQYTLTINAWYPPTVAGGSPVCYTGYGTFTRTA